MKIMSRSIRSDNESAGHFYIKNGFKSYRNYLYKEVDSM